MKKITFSFFFSLIILLSSFSSIFAQKKLQLSVFPPLKYHLTKPGEKSNYPLILTNRSDQDLNITPSIVDFSPLENGQVTLQKTCSFPHILISNDNISLNESFTIKAQEQLTINYLIEPPAGLINSEYPLSLLFHASPVDKNIETSAATTHNVIASNLIITISDLNSLEEDISISKIKYKKIIDSFQPIIFSILATNQKPYAQLIKGNVIIHNFLNKKVAEFMIYNDGILAESTRQLRTPGNNKRLDPSLKLIESDLSDDFTHDSSFLIGPYTITITLNNNTDTIKIFAFPFILSFTLIFVFLLIIIFLWIKLRKSAKAKKKKSSHSNINPIKKIR